MNNEISKSRTFSSVTASIAAGIISDTPIVSIAGATLSEITTTTTSTTTTPTPTPIAFEATKAPTNNAMSQDKTQTATNDEIFKQDVVNATDNNVANAIETTQTSTVTVKGNTVTQVLDSQLKVDTSAKDINANPHCNYVSKSDKQTERNVNNSCEENLKKILIDGVFENAMADDSKIQKELSTNILFNNDEVLDDTNDSPYVDNFKNIDSLDYNEFQNLLEELCGPGQKSELAKQLLNDTKNNDKEDQSMTFRSITSSNYSRTSKSFSASTSTTKSKTNTGGSLQDFMDAFQNDVENDHQRPLRATYNARQKKFTTVSTRQREGGSLPSNVNAFIGPCIMEKAVSWQQAKKSNAFKEKKDSKLNKSIEKNECTTKMVNNSQVPNVCLKGRSGDFIIDMSDKMVDIQQQQQILQSKGVDAATQGMPYYERMDALELRIPRPNVKTNTVGTVGMGGTAANVDANEACFVDDKVCFSSIERSAHNANTTNVAVDAKYLQLDENYKSSKSVSDDKSSSTTTISNSATILTKTMPPQLFDENENTVKNALLMVSKIGPDTLQASGTAPSATGHVSATNLNTAANSNSVSIHNANNSNTLQPKKSSKKKSQQERNTKTVDVESVAGYRGNDPVEDLVKYIENINDKQTGKGGSNNENKKKERKKDKQHKLKKSNSLEELRSASKIEMDERVTAATTESNVLMRHKTKTGNQHNTSASNVDINKHCGDNQHHKDKLNLTATTSSTAATTNNRNATIVERKSERRSWGTEELQYLGDISGQEERNKERRKKERTIDIDDKADTTVVAAAASAIPTTAEVATTATPIIISTATAEYNNKIDVPEKINVLVSPTKDIHTKPIKTNKDEKLEKLDKTKNIDTQSAVEITIDMDILAINSGAVVPETAEFHVVTKKKKPKKQRNSLNETLITNNLTNNNNNNNSTLNNNNNAMLVTTTTATTGYLSTINNRNQATTTSAATTSTITSTAHNTVHINVKNKQNKNKTLTNNNSNSNNNNMNVTNTGKNIFNNLNKNTNQIAGNHRTRFNLDTIYVVPSCEHIDGKTIESHLYENNKTNNNKNLCFKHAAGKANSNHESEDSGDNNETHHHHHHHHQHQQQQLQSKNLQNNKTNIKSANKKLTETLQSTPVTTTTNNNKNKKDKSRRKSTSSMPASDKSDSSDIDSVHSLPTTNTAARNKQRLQQQQTTASASPTTTIITNTTATTKTSVNNFPTPKAQISYADIARTHKEYTLSNKTNVLPNEKAPLNHEANNTLSNTINATTTTNNNVMQKTKSNKKNIVKIDFPELVATNNHTNNNCPTNPSTIIHTTAVAAVQCDMSTLPTTEHTFKPPVSYSQRLTTITTTLPRAAILTNSSPVDGNDVYDVNINEHKFDENANDKLELTTTTIIPIDTANMNNESFQTNMIKAKSVEHEYIYNDLDQQYPSLEMSLKRHSSAHIGQAHMIHQQQQQQQHVLHTSLAGSQNTTIPNTQMNVPVSQFNFAAAAKQHIATTTAARLNTFYNNNNNKELEHIPATVDAGTTVARKLSKKEKQQQQQTNHDFTTCTNEVQKFSTSTQTNVQYLDVETISNTTKLPTLHNNNNNNSSCASISTTTSTNNSQMNSKHVPCVSGIRPAVIILNDERIAAIDGGDFTFGDFNEDELKLFDEELDEQQTVNYDDEIDLLPDDETMTQNIDTDTVKGLEYVASVKCCNCTPARPTQLETCNEIETAIIAAARAAAAKKHSSHRVNHYQQHHQQENHQFQQQPQHELNNYDDELYSDYYVHENASTAPMLVSTEHGTVNIYYQPPQNLTTKNSTYNNDTMIDFIGSAWEEIVNNRLTQVYNERTINE